MPVRCRRIHDERPSRLDRTRLARQLSLILRRTIAFRLTVNLDFALLDLGQDRKG